MNKPDVVVLDLDGTVHPSGGPLTAAARQANGDAFFLRGTLAAGDGELHRFVSRLGHAATVWASPSGPR